MKRGGFDTSRANPKARASFDMDRDRAFERSSRGSRDSKDEVVEKALEIDRRPPNELVVGLLAGRGLPAMDGGLFTKGSSDPVVRLLLDGEEEKRSTVLRRTLEPRWDESFEFAADDATASLVLVVEDWDLLSGNDFMGRVEVPLAPATWQRRASGTSCGRAKRDADAADAAAADAGADAAQGVRCRPAAWASARAGGRHRLGELQLRSTAPQPRQAPAEYRRRDARGGRGRGGRGARAAAAAAALREWRQARRRAGRDGDGGEGPAEDDADGGEPPPPSPRRPRARAAAPGRRRRVQAPNELLVCVVRVAEAAGDGLWRADDQGLDRSAGGGSSCSTRRRPKKKPRASPRRCSPRSSARRRP